MFHITNIEPVSQTPGGKASPCIYSILDVNAVLTVLTASQQSLVKIQNKDKDTQERSRQEQNQAWRASEEEGNCRKIVQKAFPSVDGVMLCVSAGLLVLKVITPEQKRSQREMLEKQQIKSWV